MRLIISGFVGIGIACLIFAVATVPPWQELAKSFLPRVSPETPPVQIFPSNEAIAVNLEISNFTEPLGLGSEANVTVNVISRKDMPNVKVQITLSPLYISQGAWPNITWTPIGPQGIDFVDGNSTWIINLVANVSISFTTRIKAVEVGLGVIVATVIEWETSSTFYKSEDALYIRVLQDNIVLQDPNEIIIFP